MHSIHLHRNETLKVSPGFLRQSCTIERINGERVHSRQTLFYDVPCDIPPVAEDDMEPFVIATLITAMEEKRSLLAHGTISEDLFYNLIEYRDAWCCWLPAVYHNIDLQCDKVTSDVHIHTQDRAKAVAAWSGG